MVFIGPNNSGKTTALQALALWDVGLRKWAEKRKGAGGAPEKRPGVAVNRRDLVSSPVPAARLLWRDLHVRNVTKNKGKQDTKNVLIEILVEGVGPSSKWACGLEFDYANEESFYCRPLRSASGGAVDRMAIPDEALKAEVSYLQPMSGLAHEEFLQQPGRIGVLIGQGRTAEVLRNLCMHLSELETGDGWGVLVEEIRALFGVELSRPKFIHETGQIEMTYRDENRTKLDLTSAGRGLQQTLLLLAYLLGRPGGVLLLDEPDAHLEILRQRQIYDVLTRTAKKSRSQLVIASHSEVILDEAADRDVVVAFVGKPHRIDDRGSQVRKSLKAIGWDQYYQAELRGCVFYLEGSTDLAILRAFARTLKHPAAAVLESPFVHYVENQPQRARDHFFGLRESKRDLIGFLLCDRIERELNSSQGLSERSWTRREIENYLCAPAVLTRFASGGAEEGPAALGEFIAIGPLFEKAEAERRRLAMEETVRELVPPIALGDPSDPFWIDTKASDEFLDRVFPRFFERVGLPSDLMRKTDYHVLAECMTPEMIDPEVVSVLDELARIAGQARPRE